MDDRARWNKTISEAAKIRDLMEGEGGDVVRLWLSERMELLKNQMAETADPLVHEEYRNKWAAYKAHRDLYVLITKHLFNQEKTARKKLDELDTIESASEL